MTKRNHWKVNNWICDCPSWRGDLRPMKLGSCIYCKKIKPTMRKYKTSYQRNLEKYGNKT